MILLLSLMTANAKPPLKAPERPSRGEDREEDCRVVQALGPAEEVGCVAVAVPPASWAHALEMYPYATRLETERSIYLARVENLEQDVADQEKEILDLTVDLQEAQKRAVKARWEGVGLTIGAIALGAGMTLGAAWAVGQVN